MPLVDRQTVDPAEKAHAGGINESDLPLTRGGVEKVRGRDNVSFEIRTQIIIRPAIFRGFLHREVVNASERPGLLPQRLHERFVGQIPLHDA